MAPQYPLRTLNKPPRLYPHLPLHYPILSSNYLLFSKSNMGFPRWCSGKESACRCRKCKRRGFNPWMGKIPWSRKWQPTPVFLPGKFHGQRSLVGYSPWSAKSQTLMSTHANPICFHVPFASTLYTSSSPCLPYFSPSSTWQIHLQGASQGPLPPFFRGRAGRLSLVFLLHSIVHTFIIMLLTC